MVTNTKTRKLNKLQERLRNLARRIDKLEPSSNEFRYMKGFYAGTLQAQELVWKWIRRGAGQFDLYEVSKRKRSPK